ncbi:MAG: YraN family protein [Pseudomonadota bacterium]
MPHNPIKATKATTTRAAGQWSETLALHYLRLQRLKLIARNFSCRFGEIDLVMQDRSQFHDAILVFVEVRYRRHQQYGGAAATVSSSKQRKIVRTAEMFRKQHRNLASWPARFDVLALSGQKLVPRVSWIKAAFSA